MSNHGGFIYIITNNTNSTLYVGVSSDIIKRIWQHKSGETKGFSKRYNLKKLIYYEQFERIEDAIAREKQLKAGSREKKIKLIESLNPSWADLYENLLP